MTPDTEELADLHHALLRARAMGFQRTAAAMQKVLDEMLACRARTAGPERKAELAAGAPR